MMDLTVVLHICVLQLVKQCQAMLEAGRVYCQTSKSFVNGLRELGHQCSGDKMMEECLDKFSKKLSIIFDAQGVGLPVWAFDLPALHRVSISVMRLISCSTL
uniref:BAR domain-containing protein n=1 Tax=Monopterus albus TaxID=43700 RepID=A0A3Q3INA2_MONAL